MPAHQLVKGQNDTPIESLQLPRLVPLNRYQYREALRSEAMLGFGHLALRESFNTRLTLTVLLITISQFNFGFDQQGFASTQAMDAFAAQFRRCEYHRSHHDTIIAIY